jgi:hypothetical protein
MVLRTEKVLYSTYSKYESVVVRESKTHNHDQLSVCEIVVKKNPKGFTAIDS